MFDKIKLKMVQAAELRLGKSNYEKVDDGSFYDYELHVGHGEVVALTIEHFESYGFLRVEIEGHETIF